MYARAKEDQLQLLEDEILDIADDGTNDWMEIELKNGHTKTVLDKEAVQRSNLRIEARKWLMAKLKPKKYGDKVQHTGADGEGPAVFVLERIGGKEGNSGTK